MRFGLSEETYESIREDVRRDREQTARGGYCEVCDEEYTYGHNVPINGAIISVCDTCLEAMEEGNEGR